MLPKSLHTVRILVAVARAQRFEPDDIDTAVRAAARILGYPEASTDDPLMQAAVRQLAKAGS